MNRYSLDKLLYLMRRLRDPVDGCPWDNEQSFSSKSQERQQKSQTRVLDDIPVSLPALARASKLQKRAARTGFDWDNIADVLNKLQEEIGELKDAITQNSMDDMEQELGDVLFSCVNVARHLQIDTESALRRTNRKFEARFGYIEDKGLQQGLSLEQMPVDRMNQLWEEAKKNGL